MQLSNWFIRILKKLGNTSQSTLEQKHLKQEAMKLKNLFLIGVLSLALFSCNEADTDYLTEANLVIDIPTNAHLANLNQTTEVYQFDGIGVFCLGYNEELKNCPGEIVQVIPGEGALLSFTTIQNNETIESLQLLISYKMQGDELFQQIHSVDLLQEGSFVNSNSPTLILDDVLAPLINRLNENPRYFISIEISGTANFNFSSNAQFTVPLMIESEYSSPRFTL